MAPYILFVALGWLLALCSVVWMRAHPRQPELGRRYPKSDWQTKALTAAAAAIAAFGGSSLQVRYHWGWWVVPAVYGPLFIILRLPR